MEKSPQLQQLLFLAKQGSQADFEQLLQRYEPMLHKQVAACLRGQNRDLAEDYFQEARIAFHRAVQSYDSAQEQVAFGLYAKICVKNALISFWRKQNKKAQTLPIAEELSVCDAVDTAEQKENLHDLQRLRSTLSALEFRVLEQLGQGQKPRQIAASLQLPQKKVYNALARIQRKRKDITE